MMKIREVIAVSVMSKVLFNHPEVSNKIEAEIAAQLERLAERGMTMTNLPDTIREAIRSGVQPIPIIKLVRELTGWGLKDAKDYYDKLREEHNKARG
jgi:ribosomal protein L7/L12